MRRDAAFRVAIDLFHSPERVRALRAMPLPGDVADVLRVAAGEHEVVKRAADVTGRSEKTIEEAAIFFIEQLLLYPGADSYRVLGLPHTATHEELRLNMALLLRWLHPDRDAGGEHTVFVSRVTEAWDTLKTDERRAGYDHLHAPEEQNTPPLNGTGRPGQRRTASKGPLPKARRQGTQLLWASPRRYSGPRGPRKREGVLRKFLRFFLGERRH